jgi:hypothetical protein
MKIEDLVKDERFRASVGPEKLAIYSAEVDGDGVNQMGEDLNSEFKTVLRLVEAEGETVNFQQWHGFYFWYSSDTGEDGVSDDIENFFGQYPFDCAWQEPEFHSQVIPVEKLKSIALHITPNEGDTIKINGADYERRGEALVEL